MKRFLCLYISAILLTGILAACAGGAAPPYSAASSAAPSTGEAYYDSYSSSAESYDYESSALPLPLLTPSTANGKKIAYTVSLQLQTTGFDAGTRKLLNTVVEMGGYVQSAYINGRDLRYPDVERNATYTFRVPSETLADFLVVMEDNYTLTRLEQESQDITAQRQQTETRLDDLLEQEARLLEALEDTTDTRERLSLERQLTDVQVSIGSLTSSQTSMDNSVLYSTVTIRLQEIILSDPEADLPLTFSDRFSMTVNRSINGFISFLQGSLLFIISAVPVLLVLLIIAAVILLIMRLARRYGGRIRKLVKTADKPALHENDPDDSL